MDFSVMDTTTNEIEDLFTLDSQKWLGAVRVIKNKVIGNNKQKSQMISHGIVPRLLQFMIDENMPIDLRLESAVILGSLAKGTTDNINNLIEAGCLSVLLKDISHSDLRYVEACLRCLRTIFITNEDSIEQIYHDPTVIPHMINIISKSYTTQECITSILATSCKSVEQQAVVCCCGGVSALAPLLASDNPKVQMPTLKCIARLCYQNEQVAKTVASATYNGESLTSLLLRLLQRDKPYDMQMQAAKCLTYIYRSDALDPSDNIISHKTLPTLVRMCKADRTWEERVEGAETLAYLIEVDLGLQRVAAISDHIIPTLAEYFKYPGSPPDVTLMPKNKDHIILGNELRQAAFRAFASLGANDEQIRKSIIETENLMEHIVNGLSDPVTKVQLAAVRCLHSLSRSVQQLRTSFQDHAVWKPLMKMLQTSSEEVLSVASSTLCNQLLEFSPSKEPILECGAVELLVDLTKRDDPGLKLNGIWALMNMAFQADQKVKNEILDKLGTDQLFRLLADPELKVLMKTLGLLRNLLSKQPHIDQIMIVHGKQIMQAVILILEGDHPIEVKEQALCILANVADGDTSKEFIMANEDVLKKLMSYMQHSDAKLQIAATFCVSNLLWNDDEGAIERQSRLKDLGVQKILHQLLSTNNTTLFDKVKTALQQF